MRLPFEPEAADSGRRLAVLALASAAAGTLLGCASSAPDVTIAGPSPGRGRIVVFHLSSWTLPASSRSVVIDGKGVGEIGNREFVAVDVTPGEREVHVSMPTALQKSGRFEYVRRCRVAEGETVYLMFVNLYGGSPPTLTQDLAQVTAKVALANLRSMKPAATPAALLE